MTRDVDVVVVGGGPAGSVTALLLARAGRHVRLVDRARFPRTKACGECVNPGAVRLLESLGLTSTVLGIDPVPLGGWMLRLPSAARDTQRHRRYRAPFPRGVGVGWGIERTVLDAALLDAARDAGVEVHEGVRVDDVTSGRWGLPTVSSPSGEYRARVVVGADGLRSRVARCGSGIRPGRGRPKVSQTVRVCGLAQPRDHGRLVLGPGVTIGLAPVGTEVWNLTRVVPAGGPHAVARSPSDLIRRSASLMPEVRGAHAAGELRASGAFHWTVPRVVDRGRLLVGDAAGYFDPTTGQGIRRALASARTAAAVIDRALAAVDVPSAADLAPYARALRRDRAPGRRVQQALEWLCTHPWLLRPTLARLDQAGTLPDVVAVTGDVRSVGSLVSLRHFRRRRSAHANGAEP